MCQRPLHILKANGYLERLAELHGNPNPTVGMIPNTLLRSNLAEAHHSVSVDSELCPL